MGQYKLLCILLLTLIIESKTWPQKAREDTDNQQSKSSIPKAPKTSHALQGAVDDDEDITFPDDHRKEFSAEKKGRNCTYNICEDAVDYPYRQVQYIISRSPHLRNIFSETIGNSIDTGSRMGPGEPQWNSLCATKMHTSFPQTMINIKNVSKFIINDKQTLKQGVVFEECVQTATCAGKTLFFNDSEARCTQKHSKMRLYSINDVGEAEEDYFSIPSCCVCEIKQPKA